MRILIVDQMGGGFGQFELYRAIASSGGMDVTLLIPDRSFDGFSATESHDEGGESWKVVTGSPIFPNRSHRSVLPKLWELLRKDRFDLLHVEAEPESYQALHAVIVRGVLSSKTKIVLMSARNIDFPRGQYPYRVSWTHAFAERTTVRRIGGILAHNSTAVQLFRSRGIREVMLVPHAVDTSRFRPANTSVAGNRVGPSSFTVGYVGRFVPEKGIDVLLQASAKLGFEHQILLVGRGPSENSLRKECEELKISDRVRWAGPVPYESLPDFYHSMNVLVLPSRTTPLWKEQFGRVLIESMACGIPVVGSHSGGIPETIADGGVTFMEGDGADLAAKLTMLHGNSELCHDLQERGRERARREFSIERVAAMYRPFFERVCAGNS